MYRFLPTMAAIVMTGHLIGVAQADEALPAGTAYADNTEIMACMLEARKQNIADAAAGAFIRDCVARKHGNSFGAPKDGAASAPAPPGCADKDVLYKVRTQYQGAEQQTAQKLLEIVDIRDALLGPPPRSANQYATATTFIAISRYCEGSAKFESGQSEQVFWRVDSVKDGADTSTRVDTCSERHDPFQNGCAHVIAGKEK